MKKGLKILLIVIAALAAVIIAAVICINLFLFRTISEKETEAFLNDSQNAVYAMLASDADLSNGELEGWIAAAVCAVRNGDAHAAVAEDRITAEAADLFYNTDSVELPGTLQKNNDGNYQLPVTFGSGEGSYTVTDSFYGYIGSEPTTLTVHYTCGDQSCDVNYTIAYSEDRPYTFVITDMTVSK